MRIYIITVLIFCASHFRGQQPLDTIYANDTKNVALFFPKPIRQGITGSDNFVFTYNREKAQYFGLLQAKPGVESNLLVLNGDGSVYSYILRYKKQLSKHNYFIPLSNSIGNEKTKIDLPILPKEEEEEEEEEQQQLNNANYYFRACRYLLNNKQPIRTLQKRNDGVVLSVKNIVFDKEELYFVIQIENNSTLDYDLNFLKLSIETRQKGKKKSLQRLYQEPIYKHNLPSKIAENETVRFVFVLPKFSLSNDRRAVLELNEENGERSVEVKIPNRFINHPD